MLTWDRFVRIQQWLIFDVSTNIVSIRKLLVGMAFMALPIAVVAAETPYEIVSKYGQVIAQSPLNVGGLTAWTVEKNGQKVVLYTTSSPDKIAVIAGIVWDPVTGENLSNTVVQQAVTPQHSDLQPPMPPVTTMSVTAPAIPAAAMDGTFTGAIPESMRTVDALEGYKEGSGEVGDTVYVIIDPRCPYCQKAYQLTRPYVKQGATIKWIPTAALGHPENGIPLAATILQENDPDVLKRVLSGHEQVRTQPTSEIHKALDLNLSFMFAAFEQNGGTPGVPVAFYIDHRTGQPRMMTGLSDQTVLNDIFGQPKQ